MRLSTLVSFVTGITVGTLVGILYAPKEGRQLRNKLSYRLSKYSNKLKLLVEEILQDKEEDDLVNEAKNEGERLNIETKVKAEQLLGDIEDLMGKVKKTNNN